MRFPAGRQGRWGTVLGRELRAEQLRQAGGGSYGVDFPCVRRLPRRGGTLGMAGVPAGYAASLGFERDRDGGRVELVGERVPPTVRCRRLHPLEGDP